MHSRYISILILTLIISACAGAPTTPLPTPTAIPIPKPPKIAPHAHSIGTPRTFLPRQEPESLPSPTTSLPSPAQSTTSTHNETPAIPVSLSRAIPLDVANTTSQPSWLTPQTSEAQLEDIYFDTDSALLTPLAVSALKHNIEWLLANPARTITIEGHCDERGSNEYNLGLGHNRAQAVVNYLVRAGFDSKDLTLISYGKTRLFSIGHSDADLQLNRRVHFEITPRR